MRGKGLDFTLGLDYSQAQKDATTFFDGLKKQASDVSVKLNVEAGSSGALSAVTKEIENQANRIAAIEKAANAGRVSAKAERDAKIIAAERAMQQARVNIILQASQRELAIEKATAVQQQAAMAAVSSSSEMAAAGGNKAVMMMFQLQQVAEDWDAAGWRGIANNLSFMALMLGGKAGIAGMGALGVIALTNIIAKLDGTADAAERAKREVSGLADGLEQAASSASKFAVSTEYFDGYESSFKKMVDSMKNHQNDMREADTKGNILAEQEQNLKAQIELMDEVANKRSSFTTDGWIDGLLNGGMGIKGAISQINELRQEINQLYRETGQAPKYELIDPTQTKAVDAMVAQLPKLRKELEDLTDKRKTANSEEYMHGQQLQKSAELLGQKTRFMKEELSLQDQMTLKAGAAKEQEELRHKIEMRRLQTLHDIAKAPGINANRQSVEEITDLAIAEQDRHNARMQQLADEKTEARDLARDMKEWQKDLTNMVKQDYVDAQRAAAQVSREELDIIRQKVSASKQLVNETENHVKSLKNKIVDHETDAEEKTWEKKQKQIEKQIKQQAEWQKAHLTPLQKKLNMDGWVDQQADNKINNVRDMEAKNRIEDLKRRAEQAAKGGDNDRAEELLKNARRISDQRLGDTKNQQNANFFDKQSETINKKISELLKEQLKTEETILQAAKQARDAAIEDAQKLEQKIRQIEEAARNVSDVDPVGQAAINKANALLQTLMAIKALEGVGGGAPTGVSPRDMIDGGIEARAGGGPVKAGHGYIVGENSPEFFVPNQSGQILNADQLAEAYLGYANLSNMAYGGGNVSNSYGGTSHVSNSSLTMGAVTIQAPKSGFNPHEIARQATLTNLGARMRRG